jgi:hypothetical protein
LIQVKAAGANIIFADVFSSHDGVKMQQVLATGSAGLLLVACRPRVLFGRHHSIAFRTVNRVSAAQAHAIRLDPSGHSAMGTYLLLGMVALVIIYLFYAHPERFCPRA